MLIIFIGIAVLELLMSEFVLSLHSSFTSNLILSDFLLKNHTFVAQPKDHKKRFPIADFRQSYTKT
jgi:hypothetical protein